MMSSSVTDMNYDEILKIWNSETPDDFAIFSELYYQMFGEDYVIPYETIRIIVKKFDIDQSLFRVRGP